MFSNEDDGILIIGATNRKDFLGKLFTNSNELFKFTNRILFFLDDAFISRFDYSYNLPLPTVKQREAYLRKALADKTESDFDFASLAKTATNFSFRDLKNLCKQAKSRRIPPGLSKYIDAIDEKNLIDLPALKYTDFNDILASDKFSYLTRYQ